MNKRTQIIVKENNSISYEAENVSMKEKIICDDKLSYKILKFYNPEKQDKKQK